MKRFMLFIFDAYEPSGGMNDFVDSYDTEHDARLVANVKTTKYEKYHIFDLENERFMDEEDREGVQ